MYVQLWHHVLTVVLVQSNIGAFCTDARLNDNLKVKKVGKG